MSALPTATYLALDALGGAYANHYRFGRGGPRVVYFGGAVSRAVHEERRHSAPTLVAEAFAGARARTGHADVDLVVCPCPLSTDGDDEAWVSEHHDALSRLLAVPSPRFATVGYSAGARLALLSAILEEAAGAACFGGAGVPTTLAELEPILRARATPFSLLHLMNAGDPLGLLGLGWAPRFASVVTLESDTAPGGHPFADYLANGFATRAFAYALARL